MNAQDAVAGGETFLWHLVEAGAQEGLSIEFKGGKVFRDGLLEQSGRETLASSLASFANSAGGILIIGIDCRKVDGIDCAQKLSPISNLAKALSTLTDLVADGVYPKHNGIGVSSVTSSETVGAGYLIVDIPRSTRRPHMNQFQKTYWKRAGASKFKMEHYDVEDAFRRQTGPELRLEQQLELDPFRGLANEMCGVIWTIACTNDGLGSARNIAIRYPDFTGLGDRHPTFKQPACETTRFRKSVTCAFPAEVVVHPQSTRALRKFLFKFDRNKREADGPWDSQQRALVLAIEVMAEGMQPQTTVLTVTAHDIMDALHI